MTQQDRDLALLALHTAAASLRRAKDLCGVETASVYVIDSFTDSQVDPIFDFRFRNLLTETKIVGASTPERLLERWSPPESVIEEQRQAAERLRIAAVEYAYG